VVEIITQMIAYCGFPAATNALLTAETVFAKIDAASVKPKKPRARKGAKR
jgi:4-carboxymuconolactone decarboxylase